MLNSWRHLHTVTAAYFYRTFASKRLWTGTWKSAPSSGWHHVEWLGCQKLEPVALLERKTGRFWCASPPFWAFKGLQSLFYGVRLLPRLCFVCLSNKRLLQRSRLWHHEGTSSPYLPVQLSPLLWWWQWDTVRLASSSVTFPPAREYLQKAKAAVKKRKKIHHTVTHLIHTDEHCALVPAYSTNEAGKQHEGVNMYNYSQLLVNGCWVMGAN